MRRFRIGFILIFIVFLLLFSGCASRPKDDFSFMKDALVIDISAQNSLNTYNDQSHTVLLGVFELSDSSIFNQMLKKQGSVSKVLGADAFEGNVLSQRKFVIQPGEHKQIIMDRVDGARYLGVVAGYYKQQPDRNTGRLFSVEIDYGPVTIWRRAHESKILIELELGNDGFVR